MGLWPIFENWWVRSTQDDDAPGIGSTGFVFSTPFLLFFRCNFSPCFQKQFLIWKLGPTDQLFVHQICIFFKIYFFVHQTEFRIPIIKLVEQKLRPYLLRELPTNANLIASFLIKRIQKAKHFKCENLKLNPLNCYCSRVNSSISKIRSCAKSHIKHKGVFSSCRCHKKQPVTCFCLTLKNT